jgi:hypothetical protein
LSGSGCGAIDGKYVARRNRNPLEFRCGRNASWGGVELHRLRIIVRDAIWVILGHGVWGQEVWEEPQWREKILWKSTHSRNLTLPPRDGWVPVDKLARGKNPTLKYRMHQEE